MVGNAEKQKAMKSMYKRSQVQEGKREQEKLQRKKHVVESLHKPGIKYAHFHVRFNWVLRTELLVTPAHTHRHGAARGIMRMRIPSNILYMRNLCDFVFRSLQSYLCNMMAVLAPTLYFYNCIKCYKKQSLVVYRSILVLPSMSIALLGFCRLACFTEHFHSLRKLPPPIVLIPRKLHSWTKTLANASSHFYFVTFATYTRSNT